MCSNLRLNEYVKLAEWALVNGVHPQTAYRRHDLGSQVARLTQWASGDGHAVGEVVREVGSGLSGKQPKLRLVLSGPSAAVVMAGYRGRLAGFGVEHLDAAFAAQGRKIVVAGPGESSGD